MPVYCVCVCVCVRVCVRVCARARARARVCVCERERERETNDLKKREPKGWEQGVGGGGRGRKVRKERGGGGLKCKHPNTQNILSPTKPFPKLSFITQFISHGSLPPKPFTTTAAISFMVLLSFTAEVMETCPV